MKKILLVLFILVTSISSQCQTKEADSLISVLSEIDNEAERLPLLNTITSAHYTIDGNVVISYAEKAVALAKKLNSNSELGKGYINLGNGNIILGNYTLAIEYFTKAITVFEIEIAKNPTDDLKKSLARTYGSIGVVSSEQSNYSRAFQYYIKSISIYEELNETKALSSLYNNVGVAYKSQGEYNKALEYLEKAKNTKLQLEDPNVGITLTNIANCYLKLKKYPDAFAVFNEAEGYVKNDPRALGEWNNGIGSFYNENNMPQKASKHWNDAISIFKTIDDKFGIADTYLFKSDLYLSQAKYNESIKNASLALELSNPSLLEHLF